MKATWLLSSLLLLSAVGCGSQATVRQFEVPFAQANTKLQELYPSTYDGRRPANVPHLSHSIVFIARNETVRDQLTILVDEQEQQPIHRTKIVLRKLAPDSSEVSVQTSRSNKAVLIPSRDEAYEQKQMDAIAEKLKK
jgi:hypothetical protein